MRFFHIPLANFLKYFGNPAIKWPSKIFLILCQNYLLSLPPHLFNCEYYQLVNISISLDPCLFKIALVSRIIQGIFLDQMHRMSLCKGVNWFFIFCSLFSDLKNFEKILSSVFEWQCKIIRRETFVKFGLYMLDLGQNKIIAKTFGLCTTQFVSMDVKEHKSVRF